MSSGASGNAPKPVASVLEDIDDGETLQRAVDRIVEELNPTSKLCRRPAEHGGAVANRDGAVFRAPLQHPEVPVKAGHGAFEMASLAGNGVVYDPMSQLYRRRAIKATPVPSSSSAALDPSGDAELDLDDDVRRVQRLAAEQQSRARIRKLRKSLMGGVKDGEQRVKASKTGSTFNGGSVAALLSRSSSTIAPRGESSASAHTSFATSPVGLIGSIASRSSQVRGGSVRFGSMLPPLTPQPVPSNTLALLSAPVSPPPAPLADVPLPALKADDGDAGAAAGSLLPPLTRGKSSFFLTTSDADGRDHGAPMLLGVPNVQVVTTTESGALTSSTTNPSAISTTTRANGGRGANRGSELRTSSIVIRDHPSHHRGGPRRSTTEDTGSTVDDDATSGGGRDPLDDSALRGGDVESTVRALAATTSPPAAAVPIVDNTLRLLHRFRDVNHRTVLSRDYVPEQVNVKRERTGPAPSKQQTHPRFRKRLLESLDRFIDTANAAVERRHNERGQKFARKYAALDLRTEKALPFHATPTAILRHVEAVISSDERDTNREERYERDRALYDDLAAYCRLSFRHPIVEEMLQLTETFVRLDKPSPTPAEFERFILGAVQADEILFQDVVAACVHIAEMFSVPRHEAVRLVREKAKAFIDDRGSHLAQRIQQSYDEEVAKTSHVAVANDGSQNPPSRVPSSVHF